MKIKIKGKKKQRIQVPHYVMRVDFMEGDADGSQTNKIKFKEDEREDMERFILAVEGCNHAYTQSGRGGYDEYNGIPEYDFFFAEEIDFDMGYDDVIGDRDIEDDGVYDEIYEELKTKYNPNGIFMDHPSDSSYISTSFRGWSLVFVDADGNKQDVDIIFSGEEKARFEEIKKILK